MVPNHAEGATEARRFPREEVQFRAGAYAAGGSIELLVVSISAAGLTAHTDDDIVLGGDAIRIGLPGIAETPGTIRWVAQGRMGVEFAAPLPLPRYFSLLAGVLAAGGGSQPDRSSDTPWSRSNR